jgi:hypothetical protein
MLSRPLFSRLGAGRTPSGSTIYCVEVVRGGMLGFCEVA